MALKRRLKQLRPNCGQSPAVRLQADLETGVSALTDTLSRNSALKASGKRQALDQIRWKETLQAMESVAHGKVVAGSEVHDWLRSWGTEKESSLAEAVRQTSLAEAVRQTSPLRFNQ